ncbi:Tat protein secretion system quality control protein TatD with DNase activity [Bradyrhizobium japonicum]
MKVLPQSIEGYDFHCHVDLDKDPRATIARCDAERVFTLAVTTTPKAFSTNAEWARTSSYVFPAVGLHPELVGERFNELPLVLSLLSETAFIGEVGLDGSPQHTSVLTKIKRPRFAKFWMVPNNSAVKLLRFTAVEQQMTLSN